MAMTLTYGFVGIVLIVAIGMFIRKRNSASK